MELASEWALRLMRLEEWRKEETEVGNAGTPASTGFPFLDVSIGQGLLFLPKFVVGRPEEPRHRPKAKERRGCTARESIPSGSCCPKPTSGHVLGLPGLPSNAHWAGTRGLTGARRAGGGAVGRGGPVGGGARARLGEGAGPAGREKAS